MKPSHVFRALIVEKRGKNTFSSQITEKSITTLPPHDTLIKVAYSSLNYKDMLAITGYPGIIKSYPQTPGIDAAGIIQSSTNTHFKTGDKVLVTSYDLGMDTPGGYGEYIRVPSSWIIPLPSSITLHESMILGTAGLTAAIGVHHLQYKGHILPPKNVLVTGASGGVGSWACRILSHLGYQVTALTRKKEYHHDIKQLGVHNIISPNDVFSTSKKPLLKAKWDAAFDTLGGMALDDIIRQTKQDGVILSCGNVMGINLETNVLPFILRGISLMGVDSGRCSLEIRKKTWYDLSTHYRTSLPKNMIHEIGLADVSTWAEKMRLGKTMGRIIINLKK